MHNSYKINGHTIITRQSGAAWYAHLSPYIDAVGEFQGVTERDALYALAQHLTRLSLQIDHLAYTLSVSRTYVRVPESNVHMAAAKRVALQQDSSAHKVGAVLVHDFDSTINDHVIGDGTVLGVGNNYSFDHRYNGCERARRGCKSGEGYDLCSGCQPVWHAEQVVIWYVKNRYGKLAGQLLSQSTLYMWGHYHVCDACWKALDEVGIKNVVLVDRAEELFDSKSPEYVFKGDSHGK